MSSLVEVLSQIDLEKNLNPPEGWYIHNFCLYAIQLFEGIQESFPPLHS